MINAHLGLSYVCNMNCSHCYVKNKEHHKTDIRTNELIDKLEQLGTFYITYTMGETLLWNGFFDFAKEAKRRGFYQILLSNGSTIQTKEMVELLTLIGIKKVGISIDSSDSVTHDRNRGYDGAYKKACNAISLLTSQSNITTQIAMTIGNHNLNDIPSVILQMRELGVVSFSFLWMRNIDGIVSIKDIKEYEKTMRYLIKLRETEGLDINVHDYRMNNILKSMYEKQEISVDTMQDFYNMNSCHALTELVLIDPSGDMYACNFASEPFANIYTTPLDVIAEYSVTNQPLCGGKKYALQ